MATVYGWLLNSHAAQSIPMPTWDHANRIEVPGTAVDGVFLLQKGFVKLDNSPITLNTSDPPLPGTHVICDSKSGNLLMLFLALQEACNNVQAAWLNPIPYLQSARYPGVRIV
jgi:hypothetical protein